MQTVQALKASVLRLRNIEAFLQEQESKTILLDLLNQFQAKSRKEKQEAKSNFDEAGWQHAESGGNIGCHLTVKRCCQPWMEEHGINAQMASWYVKGIYQTVRAEGGPHVTTKVMYICRALVDHSYHMRVLWDTCEGIYKHRNLVTDYVAQDLEQLENSLNDLELSLA